MNTTLNKYYFSKRVECEKMKKDTEQPIKINYNSKNITKLLDRLLKGYDRRIRPNYSGEPVVVGITSFYLTK